jgi:hypothetical protein
LFNEKVRPLGTLGLDHRAQGVEPLPGFLLILILGTKSDVLRLSRHG